MEFLKSRSDEFGVLVCDPVCLCSIAKVHQSTYSDNNVSCGGPSDNPDNETLNISVGTARHLLERQDTFLKVTKSYDGLKDRKPKIYFGSTQCVDAPFAIVIPEFLVEYMEHFRGKKPTRA